MLKPLNCTSEWWKSVAESNRQRCMNICAIDDCPPITNYSLSAAGGDRTMTQYRCYLSTCGSNVVFISVPFWSSWLI